MYTHIMTRRLGKDSLCLQKPPFIHKENICQTLAQIRMKTNLAAMERDVVRVYDQEMKQNFIIAAIEKEIVHIKIGDKEWIIWELKTKDIIGNNEIILYAIGEPNTRAKSQYWQVVCDYQIQDRDGICDFFARKSGFLDGKNVSINNGDVVNTIDSFREEIFNCLPRSNGLQIDKSLFYLDGYNYYYDVEIVLDEESIKTNLTSQSNGKKYKTLCDGMKRLGINDLKEFGNIVINKLKNEMMQLVKNNPDWIEIQRYFNENEGKYGKVHDEFVLPLEIEGDNYVFKASIACKSQRDDSGRIYRIVGTAVNTPWITMSNVALAYSNGEVPRESWVSQMNDNTRSFFAQFKKQQHQQQQEQDYRQQQGQLQQPLLVMQQGQQVQQGQQQVNGVQDGQNGQNGQEHQFRYMNNSKNNVNISRSNSGMMMHHSGAPLEQGQVQFNQNLNHMIVNNSTNNMNNNNNTTTNNNNNVYNPIFNHVYHELQQQRQAQQGQPFAQSQQQLQLQPPQLQLAQASLLLSNQYHQPQQLSQSQQNWQQLPQQQQSSMAMVMTNVPVVSVNGKNNMNYTNPSILPSLMFSKNGSNSNPVKTISSLNGFEKGSMRMNKEEEKQMDKNRKSVKQKKKGCISSVTTNDNGKNVQGYDYWKAQEIKKRVDAQCMSGDAIDIKTDNGGQFSRVRVQVESGQRDGGIVHGTIHPVLRYAGTTMTLTAAQREKTAEKQEQVDGANNGILLSPPKKDESQNRNGEDMIAMSRDVDSSPRNTQTVTSCALSPPLVDDKDKQAGLIGNRNKNGKKSKSKSKSNENMNVYNNVRKEKKEEKELESEAIDDRESINGDENEEMNDNGDGYVSDDNNYNNYNIYNKSRKEKRISKRVEISEKNEYEYCYFDLETVLSQVFCVYFNENKNGDTVKIVTILMNIWDLVSELFVNCNPSENFDNFLMSEIYLRFLRLSTLKNIENDSNDSNEINWSKDVLKYIVDVICRASTDPDKLRYDLAKLECVRVSGSDNNDNNDNEQKDNFVSNYEVFWKIVHYCVGKAVCMNINDRKKLDDDLYKLEKDGENMTTGEWHTLQFRLKDIAHLYKLEKDKQAQRTRQATYNIYSESKNEEKFRYTGLKNAIENGFGAINMNWKNSNINRKIRFMRENFQNVCVLFSNCNPNANCGDISIDQIYYRTDRVSKNVRLTLLLLSLATCTSINVNSVMSNYDKFWQLIYELNSQFRIECSRMLLTNGKKDKSVDYWKIFNEKLNEIERKGEDYKSTQTVWCLLTKWFGEISIQS